MNESLLVGPYRRILFCTDFTEQADGALRYAIDAAIRNPGSQMHLLHVFNEPDAQFWRNYVSPESEMPFADQIKELEKVLVERYQGSIPSGSDFVPVVCEGEPVSTILNYVQKYEIDLLVMGRANRGRIANWLLGNVMGRVAAKAECPILIVPVVDAE